jgi:hypothetical protein
MTETTDLQKKIEEVRAEAFEEGRRQGGVEARLDMMNGLLRDQQGTLTEIQRSLTGQDVLIARMDAAQQQSHADHLETKARVRNLEDNKADRTEVIGVDNRLKDVAAKLDNFLLKLALAGLGGGGAAAASLTALRLMRVIP